MSSSAELTLRKSPHIPNFRATLYLAARNGKVGEIQQLLEDLPIDYTGSDNVLHKALILAISEGYKGVVDLLIEFSRSRSNVTLKEDQALLKAVESGFVDIVQLLIQKGGASPKTKDTQGQTPLILAVKFAHGQSKKEDTWSKDAWSSSKSNHEEIVQYLINCDNSDVNAQDKSERTALSYAAELGGSQTTKLLLAQKAIRPHIADAHGRTALSYAAERGHSYLVKRLLRHSSDTSFDGGLQDKNGRTPLSWAVSPTEGIAISLNHVEVVRSLLKLSTKDEASKRILEPDYHSRTALSFAVVRSDPEDEILASIVRLLLRSGNAQLGPTDQDRCTILFEAARNCSTQVMRMLLSHKDVDLNYKDKDGRTAFSAAAASGNEDAVRAILDMAATDPTKIDLNSYDNQQHWTALHHAAEAGHKAVVQTLVDSELVNKECLDIVGHTPLALAALKHFEEIVKLLAEATAPLHTLARDEINTDYLRLLLQNGCDVNSKDGHLRTLLHVAVSHSQPKVVEELLHWDPAINSEDSSGMTALGLGVNKKCKDIVTMLLRHSANTIGLSPKDWFSAYNRDASCELLQFSQTSAAEKLVRFVPKDSAKLQLEPDTARHMVYFDEYALWCKHLPEDVKRSPSFGDWKLSCRIQRHEDLANITVTGQYPIEQEFQSSWEPQVQFRWRTYAIGWNMRPPSASEDGSSWISICHFSMIPLDWIPESGSAFFVLFLQAMKSKWLIFCNVADSCLIRRRREQLQGLGKNAELIGHLAEDAKNLAILRNVLQVQIRSAKRFAERYSTYDRGKGLDLMQNAINDYDDELSKRVKEQEQTVRDLLQFEFAWVSINEAHRSTSIATSVKRLSWITFIFLPAMFASSIFGMNVNILASNPDWRWFLLLAGGLLIVTISVWLLFKYGQIETRIEQIVSERQRLPRTPTKVGSSGSEP